MSSGDGVDFGAMVGRYAGSTPDGRRGVERRFQALLGSSRESLPEHMRAMLSLIPGRALDWALLTHDVRLWSLPDGPVQRGWARSYRLGLYSESENGQAAPTGAADDAGNTPDAGEAGEKQESTR